MIPMSKIYGDEPEDFYAPPNMSRGARNLRIYKFLKGMGLDVCPIFVNGDTDEIKEIIVSA